MKKVFISVGPIPARLDTVKFVKNGIIPCEQGYGRYSSEMEIH